MYSNADMCNVRYRSWLQVYEYRHGYIKAGHTYLQISIPGIGKDAGTCTLQKLQNKMYAYFIRCNHVFVFCDT